MIYEWKAIILVAFIQKLTLLQQLVNVGEGEIVVGPHIEAETLESELHVVPIPFGAHTRLLTFDVAVVEDHGYARSGAVLVGVLVSGP